MKKCLVLIIIFAVNLCNSQEAPKEFRFNSMTDHVSFEETQMFGKLDTSIPLHTIALKNFNFPMSLSYNQDGNVRYNVKGGQFGDAWDLNIIGSISRRTRELKATAENVQLYIYRGNIEFGEVAGPSVSGVKMTYPTVITDEMYYRDHISLSERPDTERDVFLFNTMGISGKFFLKKNTNGLEAVVLESSDYCKLNVTTDQYLQITSFEIIDKNGYKYILENKSNVNQNISYSYISAPALGGILNSNGHYYRSFYLPLYSLNPAANNPNNSNTEIVYAKVNNGEDFWENMNLSRIYNKDNNLLVSLDYQNSPLFWIDQAYYFTDMSGYRNSSEAIVKEINVNNQAKIIFENSSNSYTANKLITNKILIKDLEDNLLKSIDFTFSYPYKTINNVDFRKILLKQLKDYSNISKPLITDLYYKENISAPDNVFDIQHNLGYITKGYYMYGYLNNESFAADMFALQKIKYPTGGSVLYKFGPNTSQAFYPVTDNLKNNLDNQNFTDINIINSNSTDYYFTVDENDLVFILPNAGDSYLCNLYKAVNGQPILVNSFRNSNKFDITSGYTRSLTKHDNPYEWPFKKLLEPGSYKLVTDRSAGTTYIKKMKYKTNPNIKNYVYVEGMRIEEIAHFKSNVAQNLLDLGNNTNSEKYTRFNYTGDEINSSSGVVFNDYRVQRPLFSDSHVFYGQIAIENRGIGKQTNRYTAMPNLRPVFKKVVKTSLHDNEGTLLEETFYDRITQSYTPIRYISDLNMIVSPYEIQVNNIRKTFENTQFIETKSETNYDINHRQVTSTISEDNLGKVTKSEFDYDLKTNTWVNTKVRNYVNNNLVGEVENNFDVKGNLLSSKFKTPDMNTYEQVGNLNTYDTQGNLINSIAPDGVSTCFIWGYDKTQIVAKLVNISYADFQSNANIQNIINQVNNTSNQTSANYNEDALKSYLVGLRMAAPNALVTAYTYKPMVGVTSIIDENGKATTYEYDTFNRLKTVKDYLGNILKEYQYNFTN